MCFVNLFHYFQVTRRLVCVLPQVTHSAEPAADFYPTMPHCSPLISSNTMQVFFSKLLQVYYTHVFSWFYLLHF